MQRFVILFQAVEFVIYFTSVAIFLADGSKITGTGIQSSQPHQREKFLVTVAPFKVSLR